MKQHSVLASLAAMAASTAGLTALPSTAYAETVAVPVAKEVSIPFVGSGSIRDYRADGRSALYVQDVHGKWYRAELMGNCLDLDYAQAIGFDVRGTNSFDKFSSVIVRGQSCPLKSLVASEPPPKKAKKKG